MGNGRNQSLRDSKDIGLWDEDRGHIRSTKKATHIFGGLHNKRVRRCSRGSNGISTRDSISFGKGEGKKTKADATLGDFRSSGVGLRMYMILFFSCI